MEAVIKILMTQDFSSWLKNLKDLRAKAKIQARILRLRSGNFGDSKAIGEGFFELRIQEGKGYRIYFRKVGTVLVILLNGGHKDNQQRDIEKAKIIFKNFKKEDENEKDG